MVTSKNDKRTPIQNGHRYFSASAEFWRKVSWNHLLRDFETLFESDNTPVNKAQ